MSIFVRPLVDALRRAIVAFWRTKRDDVDTGPGSDVDIDATGMAHMTDGLHAHIVQVRKSLYPGTASDQELNDWLRDLGQPDGKGGYGLIQAQGSEGPSALRVTCTAAPATVVPSDQLKDAAGLIYAPTGTTNWTGTGDKDISVEAISEGYATNLEAGATLEFLSAPTGIQAEATLVLDLDKGRDKQTNTEGREAAVDFLRAPNMSGNWPEWRRTVNEAGPGLYESFVYMGRNNYPFGYGCADVAILQANERWADRILTEDQEAEIFEYLSGENGVPYLLLQHLRILGYGGLAAPYTGSVLPIAKTVEVEFELAEGTPSNKTCSWDAQTEKRYVVAQDSAKKMISVNAVYTTGPQVGESVFIDGYEAVVTNAPGDAVDPDIAGSMAKFKVADWPWTVNLVSGRPSVTGFYVMSGGGLISAIWASLQNDYIKKLGPAKHATAAPQGAWADTLQIDAIKRWAANAGEGWIVDFPLVYIDGAAVDYAPNYDTTNQVELLMDDGITVWEKK